MRYNQLIFLMSLDWPHSNLSPSESNNVRKYKTGAQVLPQVHLQILGFMMFIQNLTLVMFEQGY